MNMSLFKHFDKGFFLRFVLLFLGLHYFHLFYYGLTTPTGGLYSSFLQHHLNYIDWAKSFILYSSNLITQLLGFPTHIENQLTLKVYDRSGVNLNFSCLGLGLCSFWVAFIVAHKTSWLKKLYWCLIGILFICFINCLRIALLLISMEKDWSDSNFLDHHDLFNLGCYAAIFFLIYMFDRKNEKRMLQNRPVPEVYSSTVKTLI